MGEEVKKAENRKPSLTFQNWKWWKVLYKPEDEDIVIKFKDFCKSYGVRHIGGIKLLLDAADSGIKYDLLVNEIAKIKLLLEEETGKTVEEEGVPTLGGKKV